MRYAINKLDDYDKALKFGGKQLLCYSPDQFKHLEGEPVIIGEVRDHKDDKDAEKNTENTIVLSSKVYPVYAPGDTGRVLYACRGYISVGNNEYIALFKNRLPFLLWLLGLLAAAAIALAIILILTKPEPQPTFNPLPPVDDLVDKLPDTDDTPANVEEGGGKVDINYSPTAKLSLSTGNISIKFTNPGISSHDIVVGLYVVSGDSELIIAESGRIPAGHSLSSLQLSADPSIFNGTGSYSARYHLRYYDHETGEKALVDSVLDNITLKVEN